MIVNTRAVHTAVAAVNLDDWGFGEVLGARNAVSCGGFAVRLVLSLVKLVVLRIGFVDVASEFQVEFALRGRSSARFRVGVLALLAFS